MKPHTPCVSGIPLFLSARRNCSLVKLTSTTSGTQEHNSYRLDGVKKSTQPYPQKGPGGKFQSCFQMDFRERQIAQLEQLLAKNVAEEQLGQTGSFVGC